MIWNDNETTGLSSHYHDVIQCALVHTDDKRNILDKQCWNIRPSHPKRWDKKAESIHGIKLEEAMEWEPSFIVIEEIIAWLEKIAEPQVLAGFNVGFDQRFLYALFERESKVFEYVDSILPTGRAWDTYRLVQKIGAARLGTKKRKLEHLCKHFGINHGKAHNALDDILATIELDKLLTKKFINPNPLTSSTLDKSFDSSVVANKNKMKRYLDSKYVMINGDGTVYISEHGTRDPLVANFIFNYLCSIYGTKEKSNEQSNC